MFGWGDVICYALPPTHIPPAVKFLLEVVPVTLSVNQIYQPGFTSKLEVKWREAEVKSRKLFLALTREQGLI